MNESRQNLFKIVIVIICLVSAATVAYQFFFQPSGIDSVKEGDCLWMKCSKCDAVFEMEKRHYYDYVLEHGSPMNPVASLPCTKCGQTTAFRAVKCEQCGDVFFYGLFKDCPDKCPKCGHSRTRDSRTNR